MHFIFGTNNQVRVINQQLAGHIKKSLIQKFCEVCKKVSATKVAFVNGRQNLFTCNNCQLSAVGGSNKNLSQKSLLPFQKLSTSLTQSLILYQSQTKSPPQQTKQTQSLSQSLKKQSNTSISSITSQLSFLKQSIQNKLNQIIKTTQQQNSVFLYEEFNKIANRKDNIQEIKALILKKAQVDKMGLRFIDTQRIQKDNQAVNQRVIDLKQQLKLNVKEIDSLTNLISSIQL